MGVREKTRPCVGSCVSEASHDMAHAGVSGMELYGNKKVAKLNSDECSQELQEKIHFVFDSPCLIFAPDCANLLNANPHR